MTNAARRLPDPQAYRDPRSRRTAELVWVELERAWSSSPAAGACVVSNRRLAELSGVSLPTVMRRLRDFRVAGWIDRVAGLRERGSSQGPSETRRAS